MNQKTNNKPIEVPEWLHRWCSNGLPICIVGKEILKQYGLKDVEDVKKQ